MTYVTFVEETRAAVIDPIFATLSCSEASKNSKAEGVNGEEAHCKYVCRWRGRGP
jgi:hypothetical protein